MCIRDRCAVRQLEQSSSAPTGSRYGGLSVGVGGTGRLPLFRAPSSAAASAQSTRHSSGGASYVAPSREPSREPSFHFGEVDLFAQPASAFGTVERTVSSLFGPPPGTARLHMSVASVRTAVALVQCFAQ